MAGTIGGAGRKHPDKLRKSKRQSSDEELKEVEGTRASAYKKGYRKSDPAQKKHEKPTKQKDSGACIVHVARPCTNQKCKGDHSTQALRVVLAQVSKLAQSEEANQAEAEQVAPSGSLCHDFIRRSCDLGLSCPRSHKASDCRVFWNIGHQRVSALEREEVRTGVADSISLKPDAALAEPIVLPQPAPKAVVLAAPTEPSIGPLAEDKLVDQPFSVVDVKDVKAYHTIGERSAQNCAVTIRQFRVPDATMLEIAGRTPEAIALLSHIYVDLPSTLVDEVVAAALATGTSDINIIARLCQTRLRSIHNLTARQRNIAIQYAPIVAHFEAKEKLEQRDAIVGNKATTRILMLRGVAAMLLMASAYALAGRLLPYTVEQRWHPEDYPLGHQVNTILDFHGVSIDFMGPIATLESIWTGGRGPTLREQLENVVYAGSYEEPHIYWEKEAAKKGLRDYVFFDYEHALARPGPTNYVEASMHFGPQFVLDSVRHRILGEKDPPPRNLEYTWWGPLAVLAAAWSPVLLGLIASNMCRNGAVIEALVVFAPMWEEYVKHSFSDVFGPEASHIAFSLFEVLVYAKAAGKKNSEIVVTLVWCSFVCCLNPWLGCFAAGSMLVGVSRGLPAVMHWYTHKLTLEQAVLLHTAWNYGFIALGAVLTWFWLAFVPLANAVSEEFGSWFRGEKVAEEELVRVARDALGAQDVPIPPPVQAVAGIDLGVSGALAPNLVGLFRKGYTIHSTRNSKYFDTKLDHLKTRPTIKAQASAVGEPVGKKAPDFTTGRIVQAGFGVEGYRPVVFESNFQNEATAVFKRTVCATPVVDKAFMQEYVDCMEASYDLFFPGVYNVEPLPFDEYIKGMNSSPSVKAAIVKARREMEAAGITGDTVLSKKQLYEYTTRKSFVKVENNCYESPADEKDKAARLIQGATPEFVAWVGPFIAALQARCKRNWSGKKHGFMFTSGRSMEECAKHVTEHDGTGTILEDDIGAYDSSIGMELCKLEVSVCKRAGASKIVLDLLEENTNTKGRTACGWRYKVKGTRKSGDPFTSLFNTYHNGGMKVFLYAKYTARSIREALAAIRMLAQGDDNLMWYPETKRFDFGPDMARLGFESECLYRDGFDEAGFCSQDLILTDNGWVFIPQAGKLLCKFGYFINPPTEDVAGLLRGVAVSMELAVSPCPPLRALVAAVLAKTADSSAIMPKDEPWKMKATLDYRGDQTAWVSFCSRYGWSEALQKEFERDLHKTPLGRDLQSSAARLLVDRHTAATPVFWPTSSIALAHMSAPRRRKMWTTLVMVTMCLMCVVGATGVGAWMSNVDGKPEDSFAASPWRETTLATGLAETPYTLAHYHAVMKHQPNTPIPPTRKEVATEASSWTQPNGDEEKGTPVKMSGISHNKQTKHNKQHTKKNTAKKVAKEVKQVAHAAAAAGAARIRGHGDYRVTPMTRIRGRGDYITDTLGGIGQGAGQALGGIVSGGVKAFGKLLGFGDYRVAGPRSNSLMRYNEDQPGAEPSTAPFTMGAMAVQFGGKKGSTVLCHREFICDVLSTGPDFHTTAYPIQPGIRGPNSLFPWGSGVAQQFQQYEMHGMVLEFVSTSSNFAAGSALGTVMMSTLYDANATPLSSTSEVNNNDFTTSSTPAASIYHPIECASKESPFVVRYVRASNTTTSATDERLDDIGVFQLSTEGLSAPVGTQIGQLWATYEMRLIKSVMPDYHVGTTWFASSTFNAGPQPISAPTTYSFGFFGASDDNLIVNAGSSIPIVRVSENEIQFPQQYGGDYLVVTSAFGNDFTSNIQSQSFGAGITPIALYPGFSPPNSIQANAVTSTVAAWIIRFDGGKEGRFGVYNTNSGPPGAQAFTAIVPLDNDVLPAADLLARSISGFRGDSQLKQLLTDMLKIREREKEQEGFISLDPQPRPAAAAAAIPYRSVRQQ